MNHPVCLFTRAMLAAVVMMALYVGVLYVGAFLVRAISGGE